MDKKFYYLPVSAQAVYIEGHDPNVLIHIVVSVRPKEEVEIKAESSQGNRRKCWIGALHL